MVELSFSTELGAPPDRVWRWITSLEGINRELAPLLRMTAPDGVANITDLRIEPGRRLFRSWVLLFGILPFDRSDLTLLSLEEGKGFIEQSPMLSMKLWRHERWLYPQAGGTRITDKLSFQPRFATALTTWFIGLLFRHRHRVLQRCLNRSRTRPDTN